MSECDECSYSEQRRSRKRQDIRLRMCLEAAGKAAQPAARKFIEEQDNVIHSGMVRRALWRAAEDADFRRRSLANMGMALAEEGFILSDAEMSLMRGVWESLNGLSDRACYERISALARANPR